MNPNDQTWYDRLGIPANTELRTRYVYAIEPPLDSGGTPDVESLSLSPNESE